LRTSTIELQQLLASKFKTQALRPSGSTSFRSYGWQYGWSRLEAESNDRDIDAHQVRSVALWL